MLTKPGTTKRHVTKKKYIYIYICDPCSGKRVLNPFPNKPCFLRVCSTSLLKNNVGKEELARNEQFFLFPQCFQSRLDNFLLLSSKLKLSSANSFSLEESKICFLGKG